MNRSQLYSLIEEQLLNCLGLEQRVLVPYRIFKELSKRDVSIMRLRMGTKHGITLTVMPTGYATLER